MKQRKKKKKYIFLKKFSFDIKLELRQILCVCHRSGSSQSQGSRRVITILGYQASKNHFNKIVLFLVKTVTPKFWTFKNDFLQFQICCVFINDAG